ncbi:dienelactone hydrolase family protein [Corynebacterium aquatimens]|uniref:Dienelactone hydrolase n=1 Tax=Corynebacterium aquatimens TaxID=1190508 RepID=A0A931E3Y1_9CORY|nr:alpha/beta fold hydrolase [Corynebacterium aquatimens]MBG6122696.1 dienelactone hydrolase [Corynebacterium aquatimens]WJY64774.1 hypothetical protein CAQUA_00080 [Corynebacterium aquatimens]
MKALGKILLAFVALFLVFVLVIVGLRAYNQHTYPFGAGEEEAYETTDRITAISGEYLNGFHFRPHEKTHRGVVVTYGGSEGSPAYDTARSLYDDGYEVLALYFFGADNQKPTLANVPLEQFDEVTSYIADNVADATPVTVIGASKGAEFAALLAQHGFGVDNVVAFAPAHYSYSGLDFSSRDDQPSFTLRGAPIPHASFRDADPATGFRAMWEGITAHPVSYRKTYEEAAAKAPDDARIDLSGFNGNVLLFAGTGDRMWPSDVAARALAEQNPRIEAHIYPDAGHVFFEDAAALPNGWQLALGGTADGNRDAYQDSQEILRERLASWHR